MFLCLRHHGTMSPEYRELQVLFINIILNVYTLPTFDCAAISTGHWKHGTTKKLPASQFSTSGFSANTSPQLKLQDYCTRVHTPHLQYPQTSHRQDDTVSTRWSRSHQTVQDHLHPIGLFNVISKDTPSPLVTHNVGLISPHSSNSVIIRQQRHQDIMDPGNFSTTAIQQNSQWETANKTQPNLIESETHGEDELKEEELDKLSDSSLHNHIKVTESSQQGAPMDTGHTSPVSNSDKKDTNPTSFLNVSIENINPLHTTLEEHLFYSSLNLSPDDIFTLCNLLPPTLHPFPYDIFPQHLSAFPALNENIYETEDISLYEEESRPSSNQQISNGKTTIEINKDSSFNYKELETVLSSQENIDSKNYAIHPLNDHENTTEFINNESYSDNPTNHRDYNQESQDSFIDHHLIPSYEQKRHYHPIHFLETDGNFQNSETFPQPLYSDSDSITFYKDPLIIVHNNNSLNVNAANPINATDLSQFDRLKNMNHQEVNVNYKIENNKDLIKSLKYEDRHEQLTDILSQLNLFLESDDDNNYSNKEYNCSSNCNNSINEEIVQQKNGEEIMEPNMFGGLKKVAKGVNIMKQMGECVVGKANYALRKLNMIAEKLTSHEDDELSRVDG